jgi:hypothetical protein
VKEDEQKSLLEDLDQLDRTVNKVAVPLSYADELYALRNNIYAVRKRVLARAPQGSAGGAGGSAGPATAANDAA